MEHLQVVKIDLSEIEHARITKQTVKEPGHRNGTATAFYRYLDISVNSNCGELGEALVFEWKAKEPLKNHFGAVTSKVQHYPVSVVDERIVRVEWWGKSHVKPSLKRAIDVLRKNNVRVEEMNKEKLDLMVRGREEKGELEVRQINDNQLLNSCFCYYWG